MIKIFKTQTEEGISLTTQAIDDTSMPVEIDSPYLTIEADRLIHMNKMQVAIHVMRNIQADEQVAERDHTSVFKNIMLNLGMTKSGIYTYARNVRQHLSGGDAYTSNKKWNSKRAAELRAQRKAEQGEQIETPVAQPEPEMMVQPEPEIVQPEPEVNAIEEANRWCVENKDTKELLKSFTTRTAAQTYNKKLKDAGENTRWFDKEKVA